MEAEPDTTNVLFIDEYPELKKRVWLRRLNQQRELGEAAVNLTLILPLPRTPDDAA